MKQSIPHHRRVGTGTSSSPGALDDPVSVGYFLGMVVSGGHFGGDGQQPHLTLRMHLRHEQLVRWLTARLPGSRLYGPYHHGGRSYFQWMARGACLREVVVPLVLGHREWLDTPLLERFLTMCSRYGIAVPPAGAPAANSVTAIGGDTEAPAGP